MPNNVDIHVVSASGGCRVVPGLALASAGDTINWINHTSDDVFVLVPHEGLLGNPGGGGAPAPHHHARVGAGNNHQKGPVQAPAGSKINFPFCVFCKETGTFARGNSDPEIIVV